MDIAEYTLTITPTQQDITRETMHVGELNILLSVLVSDCDEKGISEIRYLLKDNATGMEAPLTGHVHTWWETLSPRHVSSALAMASRDMYGNRFIVTSDIKTAMVTIAVDSFLYSSTKALAGNAMLLMVDVINILFGIDAKQLKAMMLAKIKDTYVK